MLSAVPLGTHTKAFGKSRQSYYEMVTLFSLLFPSANMMT